MRKLAACLVSLFFLSLFSYPSNANAKKADDDVTDSLTGMQFVYVPSGSFEMGCGNWTKDCDKDELPPHHVRGRNLIPPRAARFVRGGNQSQVLHVDEC